MSVFIENVKVQIRYGSTDKTTDIRLGVVCIYGAVGNMYGRFRYTVHVDHSRALIAVVIEPRLQALKVQCLAAQNNQSQHQVWPISCRLINANQLPKRR